MCYTVRRVNSSSSSFTGRPPPTARMLDAGCRLVYVEEFGGACEEWEHLWLASHLRYS